MQAAPRIQGRVGQAEASEGAYSGKWFFEMFLTEIGAGDHRLSLGQYGPWETEGEAQNQLRIAAQLACESIEKQLTGKVSGKYIDMKTNETKSWDDQ